MDVSWHPLLTTVVVEEMRRSCFVVAAVAAAVEDRKFASNNPTSVPVHSDGAVAVAVAFDVVAAGREVQPPISPLKSLVWALVQAVQARCLCALGSAQDRHCRLLVVRLTTVALQQVPFRPGREV